MNVGHGTTPCSSPRVGRMIGSVLGLGVIAIAILSWLLVALAAFGLYKVLT